MNSQFFKFAVVGVTINALGYTLYLILTALGNEPKLTMSLLYAVGVILGFFANKSLTFKYSGSNVSASIRYLVAHVFGYLLNLSILIALVDKMGFPHQLVQAFGILAVALTMYCLMKCFVFGGVAE